MSLGVVIVIALFGAAGGVVVGHRLSGRGHRGRGERPATVRRILLPLAGPEIPGGAFEMAARLANAEGATVVPVFLTVVPRDLSLDSPLVCQPTYATPMLQALERRASAQGIAVDPRIVRGRTYRDALRRLLQQERFGRVIVSAPNGLRSRLTGPDLQWLLGSVPAEVVILRTAPDDNRHGADRRDTGPASPAPDHGSRTRRGVTATTTQAGPTSDGESRNLVGVNELLRCDQSA